MSRNCFEGAYWRAFESVVGSECSRIMKAMLLAKGQELLTQGAEEWEVVQSEFEKLLKWQARAVLSIAEDLHEKRPPPAICLNGRTRFQRISEIS